MFRALSALLCVWMIAFLTFGPSLATVGCSEPPKEGPPPIEEGTIRGLSEADTLLFYDQRGTLLAETSGTGEVRARFNAYPYGATRHQSSNESRLYAGAPRDTGVALDHMGARFYAPDLGAWTIPDPVLLNAPEAVATGEFGTANPYAYANLNPVIAVDDDGNFWHIAVGAGAGAIFGGGVEAARQYSAQGGFKGWDWGRIAAAASGGAVSGTILAVAPQTSLSSFLLANAGASAAGGVTQRLIVSGGADAGTLQDVAIDAGVGVVTAGALKGGAAALRRARPTPPPASRTRVLDSEEAFKAQYAQLRAASGTTSSNASRVCFPAGTPVATVDGQKPIESVEVGDKVYAWSFSSQKTLVRRVVSTFQRTTRELVSVSVNHERLVEATRTHPFWVVGHGWTIAADLEVGMELLGIDGNRLTITDLHIHPRVEAVYNLEIEAEHNYFAGNSPVLVHNQNVVDTDFNRATNEALKWLRAQGVDTSKVSGPFEGKFGPHAGKPIGVRFEGGGFYRIEFDARSGAHINVGVGKLKGPHIQFEGGQRTVDTLIRRLFRC